MALLAVLVLDGPGEVNNVTHLGASEYLLDLVGDLAPTPARIEPQTSADDDDQDDAENDEDRFHGPIMPDHELPVAGSVCQDRLSPAEGTRAMACDAAAA